MCAYGGSAIKTLGYARDDDDDDDTDGRIVSHACGSRIDI